MGSLRLFLAIMVLLSHANIELYGYNPGVVAVVSFFLLSGYVMTLLIQKHYSSHGRISAFYLDRAGRLYPQFLLYAALTVSLLSVIASPFHAKCNAAKIVLNFAMLPLGYYAGLGLNQCLLLPQAWSLGLELSFYLVAPFLLLSSRTTLQAAMTASAGVFVLAFSGILNADQFGYRLLPGTLFIFLAGASIANRDLLGNRAPWFALGFCASLFAVALAWPSRYAAHYNKEVLLGLMLGIPIVIALRNRKFSTTDEFLGNLSYGVFLNHFIIIWLVRYYLKTPTLPTLWLIYIIGFSMVLALVTYWFVERWALQWRRSIRYEPSREGNAAASPTRSSQALTRSSAVRKA